jgi:nitrite reductase/ring-hydroxylating ferredoxin subunit
VSRFPFTSFPHGWFQVAWSDELARGEVKPLRYFGRDLALYRTEAGAARLLDAHCPHLGAHLGHGGTVEGSCIRCPFHAWTFGEDGRCREIPYGKADPAKASVAAWTLLERDGLILAWFHPKGEAPSFEPAALPKAAPLVKRSWTIRTHVQEPLENLVDSAHFFYLHRSPGLPHAEVAFDGPAITMRSTVKMRGPGGGVDGRIEWTATGMGHGVVRLISVAETSFVLCVTPIDEERVEARFSFILPEDGPRGFGDAVVRDISRQIEEDIPIWENKVYRDQPLLSGDEAGIMTFRRWTRQFLG